LNWFWHGLVPFVGGATLLVVLYKSVHPLPAYPASWAVWATLGWILGGIAIAAALTATRKLPSLELARAMELQAHEERDEPVFTEPATQSA
jgi:hypothetical protein